MFRSKAQPAGVQLKVERLEARCLLATTYTITDLGPSCSPGTFANSYGTAVFDATHLAGRSTTCQSSLPSDYQAAFVDGTDAPARLGTLGGSTSGARAISYQKSKSTNYLTGYSRVSDTDNTHAVFATFDGSKTTMTDLGVLNPTTENTSCGNGINSSLYVVGFTGNDANGGHCDLETNTVTNQKAWYWTTGQTSLTKIKNTVGDRDAAAWAINDSNVVTGWADYQDPVTGNLFKHAFTYTINVSPSMTDLGVISDMYDQSWGQAINSKGDVVGFVCNTGHCGLSGDTDDTRQAMLTTSGGTMTTLDLSKLGGLTKSEAKGINASGVVVGDYLPSGPRPTYTPFVYDSTNGARSLFDNQVVTKGLDGWSALVDARGRR